MSRYFAYFILFLLKGNLLTGQSLSEYRLISKGLTNVTNIHQDELGVFWIGTHEGIFKYDGKEKVGIQYGGNGIGDRQPIGEITFLKPSKTRPHHFGLAPMIMDYCYLILKQKR